MADNVTPFGGITTVTMTPEKILEAAKANIPDQCLVIGYDHNGKLYIAGTHSSTPENMALVTMAQCFFETEMWKEVAPD